MKGTNTKEIKQSLSKPLWYVTVDRGALFNPIWEGGFETKLEAEMHRELPSDRVIQIRNKNLKTYIDRNLDLRGENRKDDGIWRNL